MAETTEALVVPWRELPEATLVNLLESYCLREGTDYGTHEYVLAEKVAMVRRQLEDGEAFITFDEKTRSVDIVPAGELPRGTLES